MRIIDISLPIDDSLKETHSASIDRISHADGVEHFNWVLMKKKFEDGQERFDRGERLVKPEEILDKELVPIRWSGFGFYALIISKPHN